MKHGLVLPVHAKWKKYGVVPQRKSSKVRGHHRGYFYRADGADPDESALSRGESVDEALPAFGRGQLPMQCKRLADETAPQGSIEPAVQSKSYRRSLPGQIKSGVKRFSGQSLDDITVHYNSKEPEKMQARAFTRGKHIHVEGGEEQKKDVAHEAWHVVQKRENRVPVTRREGNTPINDDERLEREADVMGARVLGLGSGGAGDQLAQGGSLGLPRNAAASNNETVQKISWGRRRPRQKKKGYDPTNRPLRPFRFDKEQRQPRPSRMSSLVPRLPSPRRFAREERSERHRQGPRRRHRPVVDFTLPEPLQPPQPQPQQVQAPQPRQQPQPPQQVQQPPQQVQQPQPHHEYELSEFLNNRFALRFFAYATTKQYSDENIEFVMAVRNLYPDFGVRGYRSNLTEDQVYNRFVREGADCQVNLPFGERKAIDDARDNDDKPALKKAYKKAHDSVIHLLKGADASGFAGFKRTRLYQEAVATAFNPDLIERRQRDENDDELPDRSEIMEFNDEEEKAQFEEWLKAGKR